MGAGTSEGRCVVVIGAFVRSVGVGTTIGALVIFIGMGAFVVGGVEVEDGCTVGTGT